MCEKGGESLIERLKSDSLAVVLVSIFSIICPSIQAQWKWNDPLKAGFPVMQNQAWVSETSGTYCRLPDSARDKVRSDVWNLSQHAAGLAIHFYTNSPEIQIRYQVSGAHQMSHMPATGVSGVDLYSIDSDGKWHFNFGSYAFGDSITYHYRQLPKDRYHKHGFEYRLYLPLYNKVEWLEIGVQNDASFQFIPVVQDKPIVLYGTSIAHGACASRPAMNWSTIVQRAVDHPLINLGFSGNGRLEKPVIDLLCEIDSRLYILDCLPNVAERSEEDIFRLVTDAVKQIREKRTTPILLIEHAGYANASVNATLNTEFTRANKASRRAYESLLSMGIKDLYYLSCEAIGISPDAWVDHVHLTDLGMQQQALAVETEIRKICKETKGNISTTIPVTQRREPGNYEWMKRHDAILELDKADPPRAVILGNSITHFWGGKPDGPRKNGVDSWDQAMAPAGYRNLGYGWDRIENVLWRVYHGEIDNPSIRQVTIMIGTNNLGTDTDSDIIEGLRFLLSAIKARQSTATIKVVGILQRRNFEQRITTLNRQIKQVATDSGCLFTDPGQKFLGLSGKIDESFFSDGLHPNGKGYQVIAGDIAR